jgi:CBS domain-containing protein
MHIGIAPECSGEAALSPPHFNTREGTMNARELMTPDPQVVNADEPVSYAAQLMRDYNIGVVPVVDNRVHLRPVGVLTDRDIAIRCVADRRSLERNVEDFMTIDRLVTVTPDADVAEVMQKMEHN